MKRLLSPFIPLLLLVPGVSCLAQTVTGAVRGTITHSSGAIVPSATATATGAACRVSGMQRFFRRHAIQIYSMRQTDRV
jgi:hypothetical protein